ncbi:hypothetical protein V2V46_09540 [Streptococcus agalactiae]
MKLKISVLTAASAVTLLLMASSQFFSKRKTRKPPAMLVANKAFSFHLFFLYNLSVQVR